MGRLDPCGVLGRTASSRRTRGHRLSIAACSFLSLVALLALGPALLAQTISPQRQTLLKRKGELLKEIKEYDQKKADAQKTLEQGASLRDMAAAANQPDQANIYARAVGVAQQTIDTADKYIADDNQRLDAINRALTWRDSALPLAVPTIVRGHITVEGRYGSRPFDPTVPVEIGQHISVGDDGFLELQLEDGSEMHLGPNTNFEYGRDVQGVYYQLFRGEMHKVTTAVMGVRAANDEPRYKGLQAIGAVRGTDFTLEIAGTQDVFAVFEGEVDVDPGGGRDKVSLHGGQKLAVPRSGPVGPPIAFDSKIASRWWER